MYPLIYELLVKMGISSYVEMMGNAITILILFILCFLLRLIVKSLLNEAFIKITKQGRHAWDGIVLKNKTFERLSNLVIPFLLGGCYGSNIPGVHVLVMKTAGVTGVFFTILLLDSLLHSVDEIYQLYEISKIKPIRGFLQVVRVAVSILGGIIGVAILLGKSPLVLIGGIGAMTAVTSFIFKDAILGFVAGIQLTANDMVRIGDWIELPKYLADGTVVDLSMTTVKIENFDKTITSIPAYVLVSEAFINWRGMEDCGGRRIKRSIYLNPASVKPCDEEMMGRFQKISLLNDYLGVRMPETNHYNQENGMDSAELLNGKRITNIGTFRAYVTEYLTRHPDIRKDMPLLVRLLEAEEKGLPLEIYAFANTTKWSDYESIQSDIFDHLYSVASQFDLTIFHNYYVKEPSHP